MRAVQITGLDGPEAITVNDVDEPDGDGILIDVHAAGVAFPDALLSRGLYQYKPELPFIPGGEVAGVVRSAPADAHVQAGDRVLGLTMITDGMAEVVLQLPADARRRPAQQAGGHWLAQQHQCRPRQATTHRQAQGMQKLPIRLRAHLGHHVGLAGIAACIQLARPVHGGR